MATVSARKPGRSQYGESAPVCGEVRLEWMAALERARVEVGGYLHRRPAFAEVGDLVALAQQRGEHGRVGVCAAARTVPCSDRVSDAGDEGLVVISGRSLSTRLCAAIDAKRAVGEAAGRGVSEVRGRERRVGAGRRDGQRHAAEPRAEQNHSRPETPGRACWVRFAGWTWANGNCSGRGTRTQQTCARHGHTSHELRRHQSICRRRH